MSTEDVQASIENTKKPFAYADETVDSETVQQQLQHGNGEAIDETSPLLGDSEAKNRQQKTRLPFHKRVAGAAVGTCRLIVAALLAPGRLLVACFYDDAGRFSIFMPWINLGNFLIPKKKRRKEKSMEHASSQRTIKKKHSVSDDSLLNEKSSAISSDSEGDGDNAYAVSSDDSPACNTRSRSVAADSVAPSTAPIKSIRIKTVHQDELRRRKQGRSSDNGTGEPPLTVATIKSPTSPSAASFALTKYPRAPAPPRPLVPKRQPSYSTLQPTPSASQKTLIIDLDETLIHSMAKGGRMGTGHMVEVRLASPVGSGGSIIAPQVPILYYVHKRPHCDEFLRKVSKWYNLIVFTASVQEYADPVIDWLELERKYFSARYYRQHCTYRNGSYIKDLSHVEPDLSRVMILDNSPISYIFHEDNAIPIEGWISDPTDNDLLHLIPLLEGLQYATDVRALLALRLGEASS